MNVAEERVLEHALGEMLGGGESDFAERVLRRLREEERGEPATSTTLPGWIVGTAAAGLALASALWIARPVELPGAVASSDAPLEVLHAGSPELRLGEEFGRGATLVNGPEEERLVSLAHGGTIRMGRCSMLTLEFDSRGALITPHIGTLTVRSTDDAGLRLRTPAGTVALGASGTLSVEMVAEGYTLEHPEKFRQLAKEMHMKTALPLIVTLATLVEGTAALETTTETRPLVVGETLQDDGDRASIREINAKLLEEVGTWDLEVTHINPDGTRGQSVTGVEECFAGPGDKWLFTEQTISVGGRERAVFTLLGFDPSKGRYNGSLVDNFGGEIGLLKGFPTPGLESRTIEMYSGEGTPDFDARMVMRWESPDLRRSELLAPNDDGEWVVIRELVHRRRK